VHKELDAVYVPEMAIDIEAEARRLKAAMDRKDCVNIFVSEGANVAEIVAEMEAQGEKLERDAFGHVKLDKVNVGDWFSKRFARLVGAERTLVQKSGYFARSAAPNAEDLRLIKRMVDLAVQCGLAGRSGVIGEDEERGNDLRAIELPRIKGGKAFDVSTPWFGAMLAAIGQPMGAQGAVKRGGVD
jgi:pyrophosphate--fructose-6-phosphate 1-phosphotransferase